jgi:hypothetical protein
MEQGRCLGVIATAFVALFGGSALAHAAPAVSAHRAVGQRHGGWMAGDANPADPWLYIAGADEITIFNLARHKIVGTIKKGLSTPGGIALDSSGTLYVPNERGAAVTIYAAGSTSPSLTLTGSAAPQGVAVDSGGNVYVCNRGSNPGIAIYSAGQTTPSQYITSSLFANLNQLIFDAAGTLYISGQKGVLILASGSQTVTSLGLTGYGPSAAGIAIDPLNNDLIVSDSTEPPDYMSLYLPGQQQPKRTRKVGFGGLDFLGIGTMRGNEVVFVPDSQGPFIDVFKPSLKGEPVAAIPTPEVAISVAFKPAGVP